MNSDKNNEKGVTIISLVVTILIMLILAGVTAKIALSDNNGIIQTVQEETKGQQNSIKQEEEKTNAVMYTLEGEWGLSK